MKSKQPKVKLFNFLINEEELEKLKKKAQKENRSAANFIKFKCGIFKNV